MKAIVIERYGDPEVMVIKDVPMPRLEPDKILIKLHAAGVNSVDTYLRSGTQGYTPALPWTPGLDGAGIVEAIGEGTKTPEGVGVGSRVYIAGSLTGTYAEYCLCLSTQVHPLPKELDWAEGASLGVPYFTAARALFTKGEIVKGQSLLVHGASGGVGVAILQLAADRGIRLLGTAGSDSGRRLVESLGAVCFDHKDSEHFSKIRTYLGGGVDVIIEMLANVNLDNDLLLLGVGGRVVVVGSRGRIDIAPRDIMNVEASLLGVKVLYSTLEEKKQYVNLIEQGVRIGHIKPPIGHTYSLDDAAQAHHQIIQGSHTGNLVLTT